MTRIALRRFASVAAGSLVLFGCATHTVEFPPQTPRGHIAARPGRPGLVVAAPHGSSDGHTAEIAAELARRTGFGLVVATGFNIEPDTRETPGRRYQVNRPFEGVPSRPPSEDTASAGARLVYETFERRVREIAQGPLRDLAHAPLERLVDQPRARARRVLRRRPTRRPLEGAVDLVAAARTLARVGLEVEAGGDHETEARAPRDL